MKAHGIIFLVSATLLFAIACEKDNPSGPIQALEGEGTEYNIPVICDTIPAASSGLDVSRAEDPDFIGSFSWEDAAQTVLKSSSYLIGYYISGAPGGNVANQLSSFLSGILFGGGQSQEVKLLNEVKSKLDEMDDKLGSILDATEALYKKMDEVQLNQIMAAYRSVQQHYLLIKQLNDFTYAKLVATTDLAAMTGYINDWAATDVKGSAAYLSVMDLAQKIMDFDYLYEGTHINFCAAADLFVFSNVAWECNSYDYREAYRAQVAAELSRSINLLLCYYDIQISTSPLAASNIESIRKSADNFAAFFEKSKVVRSSNAICIIPGHRFSLTPDAFDRTPIRSITTNWLTCSHEGAIHESKEWFWASQGDAVFNEDAYGYNYTLNNASKHVEEFAANCLKREDVIALVNFFKPEIENDASITLADLFERGGVDLKYIAEYGEDLMLGTRSTFLLPMSKTQKYASPLGIELNQAWYMKQSLKELDCQESNLLDPEAHFNQYGNGSLIIHPTIGQCYALEKCLIYVYNINSDGLLFLKDGTKVN